jgi:predicted ATPase
MPRQRTVKLPAPYLRKVLLMPEKVEGWENYPFCLPLFRHKSFEIEFDDAVTIIVGENGVGKSTLFEGIAEKAGFGLAGGSTGHALGTAVRQASLAQALQLAWLPKVTRGYFFRAETFFGLVRYMIDAAKDDPFGSGSSRRPARASVVTSTRKRACRLGGNPSLKPGHPVSKQGEKLTAEPTRSVPSRAR